MADGVKQVGLDTRQINTSAPTLVSLTTSTARSAALTRGLYIITCGQNCTWLQGGSTVEATANHRRLWANTYRWLYVHGTEDAYVAGILASGTATLSIEKISTNDGV